MRNIFLALMLIISYCAYAKNSIIHSQRIKTVQAIVNNDWLSPPIMVLKSNDILRISFDELSHDYHSFKYHIQHCGTDWSESDDLFESDYLEGFNDNAIENYQNSINTTILYTHYKFEIPNDKCRLKLSGNYKLTIYDEDNNNEIMFETMFMVVDPQMSVELKATTNTDIDINESHQQLSIYLNYNKLPVTNHEEQIFTVITQNNNQHTKVICPEPNIITGKGLIWDHNKNLIFNAGNEYHKYEILALSHPTMGIDQIKWDGTHYQAYPFVNEPRNHYLYDEDANGYFYIRNSDNIDNDFTCDYVFVNYKLKSPQIENGDIYVDGEWASDKDRNYYAMRYNNNEKCYEAVIMHKQGYYSYQYLQQLSDGTITNPETEGSFYQTENRYQVYIYYRPTSARGWQLVCYRQLIFNP